MRYELKYGKLKDMDSYLQDVVLMQFPFDRNFEGVDHDKAVDGIMNISSYFFMNGLNPVGMLYFNEFEGYDGCFIHFAKLVKGAIDFRALIRPVKLILKSLLDKEGKFKYNNIYGWTPYGGELGRLAEFFGFSVLRTEFRNNHKMYLYIKEN